MGGLVNRPLTKIAVSLVAALIVGLNIYLLYSTLMGNV